MQEGYRARFSLARLYVRAVFTRIYTRDDFLLYARIGKGTGLGTRRWFGIPFYLLQAAYTGLCPRHNSVSGAASASGEPS